MQVQQSQYLVWRGATETRIGSGSTFLFVLLEQHFTSITWNIQEIINIWKYTQIIGNTNSPVYRVNGDMVKGLSSSSVDHDFEFLSDSCHSISSFMCMFWHCDVYSSSIYRFCLPPLISSKSSSYKIGICFVSAMNAALIIKDKYCLD